MKSSLKASRTTTLQSVTVVQYGCVTAGSSTVPRQEPGDTRWSKLQDHEIYFGIQGLPRAAQSSARGSIMIPLSQERPDHDLRERAPQFCCKRRVAVKYVESSRQILTLRRFTDALVRTRFLERHMLREVSGMQKAIFQNLPITLRLCSCRMFTVCRTNRFGDRALEVTTTGKSRPWS